MTVTSTRPKTADDEVTFADLGVSDVVSAALAERGRTHPFPIQVETIEATLAGRDMCGKAPTGSGKTLAFGVPMVDLVEFGKARRPRALVLAPTRELASQIMEELAPLAEARSLRILTVFGGTNVERDKKRLGSRVDILIACPGRLEDLISTGHCDLGDVDLVVLDEADRMADMGFMPSVKRILDQTSDDRHTLLFSATLDGDVDKLIKRYQHNPLTVEVPGDPDDQGDVDHLWFRVDGKGRADVAAEILRRYWSSIVFCRTRRGCDRLSKMLNARGIKAVAIHGDLSQNRRERSLAAFSSGEAQALVATDVAARGIHVDNVSLVLHFDPAGSDKDYIHRSGRTGRAGSDGTVISMVVAEKASVAKGLQKALKMPRGLDELDVESLGDVVARPIVEPRRDDKPSGKQSGGGKHGGSKSRNRSGSNRSNKSSGGKSSGGKSSGAKNRSNRSSGGSSSGGNSSGGKNRHRSNDRDDERDQRDGRSSDGRSGDGRNGDSRGGSRKSSAGGKNRHRSNDRRDRDDRDGRSGDGRDGDNRSGGRKSSGGGNRHRSDDRRDRDGRDGDDRNGENRNGKPKQGAKSGGAKGRSDSKPGGRNSKPAGSKPKSRTSKKRWSDQASERDARRSKGKRRGPKTSS